MKSCAALLLFVLLVSSCHQKHRRVIRGFYYWKTHFRPGPFEKTYLDSLHTEKLYVKFFDILWDPLQQAALPVAKIRVADTAFLKRRQLVPTVFITNETLYKLDSSRVRLLAGNIASLLLKYQQLYQLDNVKEIQMDCDWTVATRDKYFYLLERIKSLHPEKILSATIRLHQVKYTRSSGIPPVDRGLLMCYNMGNLQEVGSRNSIVDPELFKKYSPSISSYPLPLDIGLSLFDWFVLFRQNKYAGLFSEIPDSVLSGFNRRAPNLFSIPRDTLLGDRSLQSGDLLRRETSNYQALRDLVTELSQRLTDDTLSLVLYHCDSVILKKYSVHELESLFSGLRAD
ncbi:hypothetical protein [Niabella terrae]